LSETRGPTGLILHVQRLSTEDGPGIRSTVFFKQCPLSCRWCHNPESISGRPELQWYATRCIGCHSCEKACPFGCISSGTGGVRIERLRCDGCGVCARECPSNALELLGRRVSVEELVAELERDRAYYDSSSGGVTLSGGEPLAQPAFAAAVTSALKQHGIATAIDTCGFASAGNLDQVMQDADLVLFDLKAIDDAAHRSFTGQSNEVILRNLRGIPAARTPRGLPRLWIRTPLVPGATATADNIHAIGSFLADHLDGVPERWELCAFNNLCRDQYTRLGLAWACAGTPLMSSDELEAMADAARSSGVDPGIVTVTGAARTETREKERTS
jgi:pyruvate formate lyase activating enzyme